MTKDGMDDLELTVDFGASATPKRRKAPGEGSTRKAHDAYDTDPDCALACVKMVKDLYPGIHHSSPLITKILDPTSGMGPWVKAARGVFPGGVIGACDIRPECREPCLATGAAAFHHGDALEIPTKTIALCDLIITNPPFTLADPLAARFLANMRSGAVLAFLLNITFLASAERWAEANPAQAPGLLRRFPPRYVLPLVPRPAFLVVNGKKCSGKFEAGLFIWQKGDARKTIIPGPLSWKGAK